MVDEIEAQCYVSERIALAVQTQEAYVSCDDALVVRDGV